MSRMPPTSRLSPIMEEEIGQADGQSVDLDTRIVVSFPAQWGGTPLVKWLHQKLSARFSPGSPTGVYVDAIAAEILPPTTREMVLREHTPGPTLVHKPAFQSLGLQTATITRSTDPRAGMRLAHGEAPGSARRDDWDLLFQSAVRASNVFLIVLTDQYLDSVYCKHEIAQAQAENVRRRAARGSRLRHPLGRSGAIRFVALVLGPSGAANARRLRMLVPDVELVTALPRPGGLPAWAAGRVPFDLPADDYAALEKAIGRHL